MCNSMACRFQDEGFIVLLYQMINELGEINFVKLMCDSLAKYWQEDGFLEKLDQIKEFLGVSSDFAKVMCTWQRVY